MLWLVLAIVVVVVVVAAASVALLMRRSPRSPGPPVAEPPHEPLVRHTEPAAPMTGLEAALDGVTDRDGRTLREQLDAEASAVEQWRVPDDTSPILRRALDHLAHDDPSATSPSDRPDEGDGGDGADAGPGHDG